MNHPDDPVVFFRSGCSVCPDSPDQRARFERMWARLEAYRELDALTASRVGRPDHAPGKPANKANLSHAKAARQEAYKEAFRKPQGAYDRGICARY